MKKQNGFVLLILCFMLIGLTACSKPKEEETPPIENNTSTKTKWLQVPSMKFDREPIALYEKGFLVEKDDVYGFIDEKGNLLLDYKYKLMECFVEDAYGIENLDEMTYLSELLEVDGFNSGCWTGVVGSPIYIWYSTTEKAILETSFNYDTQQFDTTPVKELSSYMQNPTKTSFFLPVDITIEEVGEEPENKGYIFMTSTQTHVQEDASIYEDIEIKDVVFNPKHTFQGMALVEKNDKWAVMDDQGNLLTEFIYEDGDVLNQTYVKLEKDKSIILMNKDKKEYIFADIEDITAPIQGVVYAKQNDQWGTIQLQEE